MQKTEYVYIFSNSENIETVKIGRTNLHPEVRANQLSKQTGSIGEYECKWFVESKNSYLLEKYLHFIFMPFHHNKEFFKMNIDVAVLHASECSIKFEKLLFETNLSKDLQGLKDAIAALEILIDETNNSDKNEIENEIIRLKGVITICDRLMNLKPQLPN